MAVLGTSLNNIVHASEVGGILGRAAHAWGDPVPILRAIGTGLAANTRSRFNRGVAPDGAPWAELSPAYAPMKKGPGILRESGMRGGLQGSIIFDVGGNVLSVGTNKIYGAIHQFGGTIRPRSAKVLVFRLAFGVVKARKVAIPPRPFLGIGPEDEDTILDNAEVFMARALARGRRA